MESEEPEVGKMFLFADPEPKSPKNLFFRITKRLKLTLCRKQNDAELKRKALLSKSGHYRIHSTGLSEHSRRYVADLYISLIDLQWRYALAIMFNAFFFTFLFYAVLWWLMAYSNGDFDNVDNANHTACLMGVKGFAGSLLFSIETQTTIGYGFAYPNADCVGTLPLVYLQVVTGFMLETLLLGFIFVKVARPKYRAQTILFSKQAVVCIENGILCLQVRVGDLRKSHLLDASITAMLVRRNTNTEGVLYPLYQSELQFEAHGMSSKIFLLWPIILTHHITAESPLFDMRPNEFLSEQMEIILFLTGTVESTGEVCQARTSYVPREILWGHRFERLEEYDITHNCWHVDFASFDDVIFCQNIRHSAREIAATASQPISVNNDWNHGAQLTPQHELERRCSVKDCYDKSLKLFSEKK